MEKKKKRISDYLMLPVMILVGVVVGLTFGDFLERYVAPGGSFTEQVIIIGVLLLSVYVSFYLAIPIHEAGHLIFGLLTGYRFSSYRIGSFMWVSDGEKVRFRRFSLAGTGGQCLMCPPDLVDGKLPYVLYNLGGVFLNLFVALISLVLLLLLPDMGLLSAFFLISVEIQVLVALMNGVPMRMGNVDNDGLNAVQLGKHPAAMRAFWLQMKINEMVSKGTRLRDMPDEWFYLPSDEELQNSMCAAIGVFYENRLIDQGKLEEALPVCERLLQPDTAVLGLHEGLLICDQISCRLLLGGGKDAVFKLRTKEQLKFMKQMKTFPTVLRTEYLYALLAEGNRSDADRAMKKFDLMAKSYPYPSDIEGEREVMALAQQVKTK